MLEVLEMNLEYLKHIYDDVYIAPQGQAFYNEKGEYLGRFLWCKSIDGVYLDKDI